MRFNFTEEQELLRRTVKTFAARELAPAWLRELDKAGRSPQRALLPRMAALGFTALPLPTQFGGLGGGAVDSVILFEELGRHSLAAASVLGCAIGFGCKAIERQGSEAQKHEIFEKLTRGDFCFAYAPAGAGSDPESAVVTAQAQTGNDDYVLEGSNILVTGPRDAECLIIVATGKTEASGLSLFALDPSTPGIHWDSLDTQGLRGSGAFHLLRFDGARVPGTALVGAPGAHREAAEVALAALMHTRLLEAASCVGCAQQVVEDATRYASERQQFGQPIGKFQAISHLLVDLQVEVDAARTLMYRAAWTTDAGGDFLPQTALAHLAASEGLLRVTADAMRVYGGYGLTMEFDIQRHFRDARLFVVGDGASRSQRDLIAESMGLAP